MADLANIIPLVGRGNHATDFGVSFQQHLGREVALTFNAYRAMVEKNDVANIIKLKPPAGFLDGGDDQAVRLPGISGAPQTLALFQTQPKVFGLFLLAVLRAGHAQAQIDSDARLVAKRPFEHRFDSKARKLHKLRLEVILETMYANLRPKLDALGVPAIELKRGWMTFDAFTCVFSTLEHTVRPHYDWNNSRWKPWVNVEVVQHQGADVPGVTFCPPNAHCAQSDFLVVDGAKSYAAADLHQILHFARPRSDTDASMKTSTNQFSRLGFVFYHKRWVDYAEEERRKKAEARRWGSEGSSPPLIERSFPDWLRKRKRTWGEARSCNKK